MGSSGAVFISYGRDATTYRDQDSINQFVQRLHDGLEGGDPFIDAWLDVRSMVPGTEWEPAIYVNAAACRAMIFVATPKSLKSPYCTRERELAAQAGKPIIPLMGDPNLPVTALPADLQKRVAIQYSTNFDQIIAQVRRALHEIEAAPPTPLPIAPTASSNRRQSLLMAGAGVFVLAALLLGFALLVTGDNGDNGVSDNGDDQIEALAQTESATDIPTQTESPTMTYTPTNPPTTTAAPSQTPAHTNTTAAIIASTTMPVLLAATNTSTVGSYPCTATVTGGSPGATRLQVVRLQPSSTSSTAISVVRNATVTILDRTTETYGGTTTIWYQIQDSTGSYLGWITSDYLTLSQSYS